jgi:hypothetical protein
MGQQARYGVGEELRLMALQSLPTGRGPMATWVVVSGGGTMRNTGNNGATYTAPDLGQAQLLSGQRTFKVVLELRDPKGELAQIELEIVSPDHAGLVKLGGRHQAGVANSGFWGQVLIGPNDVSFMRILMQETRGTWNGTGTLGTWRGLVHQDTGSWIAASKMRADGTLMDAVDKVWTETAVMTAPDGSALPWKAAGPRWWARRRGILPGCTSWWAIPPQRVCNSTRHGTRRKCWRQD